jgi:predicted permease
MSVRVGLGATQVRLVQQVMTESVLLSGVAALLGIFLAQVGTGVLVRIISSGREHERFILPVQLDLRLLAFTVGVALLTALFFGLAPALHVFRSAPMSVLRQTGRAGETRLRRLFGRGLVAAQVASSVLLLSAAGLFLGYLSHLRNLDLGFQRDHVLLVTLDAERSGLKREQLGRLYEELVVRLESIPGISSVSISAVSPIQGAGAGRFVTAEGRPQQPEDGRVSLNWVAPKYFETLGTPFLAGRDFQFQDQARARVTIINHLMARYYFGDASPVGRRITLDGDEKPYEVVGVVGNAKYLDIRETPARTMYFNTFQERWLASQFALRTQLDPAAVTAEVRRAVREVLKSVLVTRVITLADQVDASIVPERLIATLSGLFGALGSLLAAIGLSGLLAYTVAQRTNEIGIRMALGATRGAMSRMVLVDALRMTFWGLTIGMPIAYWGRWFATSMIPDLPLDNAFPIVFGALTMIGIALIAAYVPAHRAARVDPMEALRCE